MAITRPTCKGFGGKSCKVRLSRKNTSGYCRLCSYHVLSTERRGQRIERAPTTVAEDRKRAQEKSALAEATRKYKESLHTIATLEQQLDAATALRKQLSSFEIQPRHGSGTGEGTVVAVASDWHVEETVGPEVSGLNTYSPQIAEQRATRFFQAVLRLTRLLQQDIRIDNLVLALLGDFITNELHDAESAEKNALHPNQALVFAQRLIVSGIQFLLDHSELKLTIPCHSGNHARTTKRTRFSAENGHSLEYLMYTHLASHFRNEPRVTFIIPEGYHSYVQVYDQTIRFHHGHAIRYQGGVGGIYIPVHKAIASWNRARTVNLDVFGHFHQFTDGGNFLCNGSMIGFNAFAIAIKAAYEPPRQTLFLIDKKRGRTCVWPVLFEDK